MNPAPWLVEFHRQWHKSRGHRIQPASRAFSLAWKDLLEAAGLFSAAEQKHAEAEALALEKQGHLTLKRHRYRQYIIESVSLPPGAEPWLIALFGASSAGDLRAQSLAIIQDSQSTGHPRWPESWRLLCDVLTAAFETEKNLRPFFWKDPAELENLLRVLHGLTGREWPPHTLIRDASVALGCESKFLEQKQAVLESALSILFQETSTLEALGILGSQSRATVHGLLTLHFEDGSTQDYHNLRGDFTIALTDLERATRATTSAKQILSIENFKTTFRQAASANTQGDTLLLATSYPNKATIRLLNLLPAAIPHHHFGDADASGYAILRSLREISPRPVQAFLMAWRDSHESPPLTEHDLRILPALISSPLMTDCQHSLIAMANAGRKGLFEQESLGAPSLSGWRFWLQATQS